jgi:AcrR family transcriptional regulator
MAYPTKTDRARILAAALQQVEDHGVENLAIRCVAGKLGLAPNALYRYFDSLTSLEEAVAEEVRLRMLEAMRQAAADKGPAEAIHAISEAYLRFAREQPRAFALFLKTSGAACATPQCMRTNAFLLEQVARVYGEERGKVASLALWAFLHGLAVLCEANVLRADELSASLAFGLDMWIDGAMEPV